MELMSEHEQTLPPASFEFLVLSMRVQAEIHLGLYPAPDGARPDLDIARHTIDLLAVLQSKTKGNLSVEEQRLLDNSVTELRFRFIQAAQQPKPAATPEPAADSSNG
jgi:hypothetical protein